MHNFKPLSDKYLHMFDLLVLSCMLYSSIKQMSKDISKRNGKLLFSEVQCMCSDREHMGKPVISPQRQWQESSLGPEGTEQSLRQHRKLLSQLNVSVNAKACSKKKEFFYKTLLLPVTLRLCYLKSYLNLYF